MGCTDEKSKAHISRPHILMLLSNSFDPDPRVEYEARVLVEAGYRVTILCWDRDRARPQREKSNGIYVERVYVRSTHSRGVGQTLFLGLFFVLAFFKAFRMDYRVIHSHDFDTLPLGYLLARLRHVPLVYDAHESFADMLENVPFWMKKIIVLVENFILPRVDQLITVGEILEHHFQSRGARKTVVVGNWKRAADFQFDAETLELERKKLGIPSDAFVVSFIANLGYERQIVPLVEAVKSMPHVFLILGGRGPAAEFVKDAAAQYSNILYLGFVPPSKIPLYTAMSQVVFYGFDPANANARFSAPNKLFEAIAAGRPVICGDFGEIGQIVRKYGLGIVLPYYSVQTIQTAIRDLSDPQVLQDVFLRASRAAQVFSGSEAARRLLKVYDTIFGKNSRESELDDDKTGCGQAYGA